MIINYQLAHEAGQTWTILGERIVSRPEIAVQQAWIYITILEILRNFSFQLWPQCQQFPITGFLEGFRCIEIIILRLSA